MEAIERDRPWGSGSIYFSSSSQRWIAAYRLPGHGRVRLTARTRQQAELRLNQFIEKIAPAQFKQLVEYQPTPRRSSRARRKITPKLRFAILERDEFRCRLCGRDAGDRIKLVIDHKKPVSLGGTDDIGNLWTLCYECNAGKGTRDLS